MLFFWYKCSVKNSHSWAVKHWNSVLWNVRFLTKSQSLESIIRTLMPNYAILARTFSREFYHSCCKRGSATRAAPFVPFAPNCSTLGTAGLHSPGKGAAELWELQLWTEQLWKALAHPFHPATVICSGIFFIISLFILSTLTNQKDFPCLSWFSLGWDSSPGQSQQVLDVQSHSLEPD